MFKRVLAGLISLSMIGLLGGCGTEDDDDHDHDHDEVSKTYSFYVNASGNLYAVDPSSATASAVEVKAGVNSLVVADADADGDADAYFVQHGTYTSSTDTISDLHYPWLVVLSGGILYKVNTLVSAGTPTATQLSSSTGIAAVCSDDSVTNFSSSSSSTFLFKEQTGANCGTASWRAVAMSADDTVAVTNIKKVISGVYNSSGVLTGYLIKDSDNELSTVDTTFTTYTKVTDNSSANIAIGSPRLLVPNRTGTIIFSDDYTNSAKLYAFDMNAGTITSTDVLHSFSTAWTTTTKDETYLYFDDGVDIYRVNRDGSAVSSALVTTTNGGVDKLTTTDDKLVYLNNNGDILSIDKTATSTAESALTIINTVAGSVDEVYTIDSTIYYNVGDVAHYVRDDNTGVGSFTGDYTASPTNTTGAFWVGVIESTTRSDEKVKDKEAMVLFSASSDTENSFYEVPVAFGTHTLGTAALSIDQTIDITNTAVFDAEEREGEYFLVSELGATGAVYAVNAHDSSSVRADDSTDSSGDEAAELLSPK
jgi:Asp-tRNA(Asn)/Glu-tRNA(Gln) amidotransferase C subunit